MGWSVLGRRGNARRWAAVLGGVYVAVALVEAVAGERLAPVLEFTARANALHWVLAGALLVAFLGTEATAAAVCRVAGALLAAVTIAGLAGAGLLGFPDAAVPVSYVLGHALMAAAALYAGFVAG